MVATCHGEDFVVLPEASEIKGHLSRSDWAYNKANRAQKIKMGLSF